MKKLTFSEKKDGSMQDGSRPGIPRAGFGDCGSTAAFAAALAAAGVCGAGGQGAALPAGLAGGAAQPAGAGLRVLGGGDRQRGGDLLDERGQHERQPDARPVGHPAAGVDPGGTHPHLPERLPERGHLRLRLVGQPAQLLAGGDRGRRAARRWLPRRTPAAARSLRARRPRRAELAMEPRRRAAGRSTLRGGYRRSRPAAGTSTRRVR